MCVVMTNSVCVVMTSVCVAMKNSTNTCPSSVMGLIKTFLLKSKA